MHAMRSDSASTRTPLTNVTHGVVYDQKTVDGVVYDFFKDACYALGLLQNDREFIDAISEAGTWHSATFLRRLFVVLLTSNNMSRPDFDWQKTWNFHSHDVLY
ncbi:hypothetical protein Ahy_B10g104832 [Arachis hypogaea]|uniref:Uncharacterized protein n=1 Tax=Arachis hypogaea TaxID=3818 RepID=A0A444X6K6_ARAHY|nr:hypothetical protein Ahy_B10g104832 [Arachis hypogaea]